MVVDEEYLKNRKVFAQLLCSFRYGREEDEVMGLKFQKDMILVSELMVPQSKAAAAEFKPTKLQERLLRKLGSSNLNAYPFTFRMPLNSPASVTLQPGQDDEGRPCGVEYFVKAFAGEDEGDRSRNR